MALIALHDVHKSYPEQDLLRGVSLVVEDHTPIGIVGANGSGKSTLMRILAGVSAPDSGRRLVQDGLRVGHLLQEVPVHTGRIRDAVRGGIRGREEVLAQIADVHVRLGAAGLEDRASKRLLAELGRLETERDRLGGHHVEHLVEELIDHVGLPDPDADASVLSGGEQRRVALARLLLSEPDVLLLDEPTNHLDTFVVDWLEDFLLSTRTPVVMVTHDRYFLDRVVDRVVEVERGALHVYEGGYAGYLRGRAAREEAERKAEVARRSLLRRETDWMRRGPPARSTKAKARIDRYHALLDGAPEAESPELAFRIPPGPRLGTRVIRLRGVTLRAGDRTLVTGLDLDVGQGERLGIVGPNGAGKSTLLHAMIGDRPPDAGSVEIGETVQLAAIDQQRRALDDANTVVEEIGSGGDHVRVGERAVRLESFLDGFLFPGGRKHTQVGKLSGGERNRVLLAKLLVQGGNVLVLDEPTNDLDLPTLRALEEALLAFEGSVIVVSHDRWFLDRVATEIVHLDGHGQARRYGGHVTSLLAEIAEERQRAEAAAARAERAAKEAAPRERKRSRRLSNWEEKELAELPAKIEGVEARLEELTERLADPALYSGPAEKRAEVEEAQRAAADEVARLYKRWEHLESLRG
jgi:ATP-binding cassette subfamily F protein uup